MSTVARLDRALDVLRSRGHDVQNGAVSPEGKMLVAIDGRLLTYEQVYRLAESSEKADIPMADLVRRLQEQGHQVGHSEVSHGGKTLTEVNGQLLTYSQMTDLLQR